MKSYKLFLVSTAAAVGFCFATASARAATCESLASLPLPNITITAAQTIPAGGPGADSW
jgi:hypothetical protein